MNVFGMVSTANSLSYTLPALESFFRSTPLAPEDHFFLIDNDGSFTTDSARFPCCEVLRNPAPLGFAANGNQLLERCRERGADLFFLNNDVIFTKEWLTPLLNPDPRILSPLCNREVQYASSVMVMKTSHVASLFVCNVGMTLADYTGNEAALEAIAEANRRQVSGFLRVYVLPFFCVKIPYCVQQAVGRFDESFGTGGGEDYDYCLRAYLAGFEVGYALGSFNLHFGGKSTWAVADAAEEQLAREAQFRAVFREKWGPELHDMILREDGGVAPAR